MNAKLSKLHALALQGRVLLQRGNVSMEEANSFIGISDAVLSGAVPAVISAAIPTDVVDPDSRLELAVTEVQSMADAEADIGQVPPADSVISMDDPVTVAEVDSLVDESEELTAISEFGAAIVAQPTIDVAPALEHFRATVVNCFNRIGVSVEDIEQVVNATDIDTIVSKVDDVRDIADGILQSVEDAPVETVSTEALASLESYQVANRYVVKARVSRHVAALRTRKEK